MRIEIKRPLTEAHGGDFVAAAVELADFVAALLQTQTPTADDIAAAFKHFNFKQFIYNEAGDHFWLKQTGENGLILTEKILVVWKPKKRK